MTRELGITEKVALWCLDAYSFLAEGVTFPFMGGLFQTYELPELGHILKAGAEIQDTLESEHGPIIGQLIMAYAALWSGCEYCGRGHLLASNLHRFEETGELFPLTMEDLSRLRNLSDDEILSHIDGVLREDKYETERSWAHRMYQTFCTVDPLSTPTEDVLISALRDFRVLLNEGTMTLPPSLTQNRHPLSDISREVTLTERYLTARRQIPLEEHS
jgi:hypothetical protein